MRDLTRLQHLEAKAAAWQSFRPLSRLTDLRSLNLLSSGDNRFQLELPECLLALSRLTSMTLVGFDKLNGDHLYDLSHPELLRLCLFNLESIGLRSGTDGRLADRLADAADDALMSHVPALTALQLMHVDCQTLMPAVCYLTSLRVLELDAGPAYAYDESHYLAQLPQAMSRLSLLQELRITQPGRIRINADIVLSMTSLQTVAVLNCQNFGFVGKRVCFTQLMAARPCLQFDLRHTCFGPKVFEWIASSNDDDVGQQGYE